MADEVFEIKDAAHHATPQVMAVAGPMFSGKSYGAIMLAAGLTEPGDMIGVIDTENGKFGNWYADDPDVVRLIPQGFKVIELMPPFHANRLIAANQALERAGCKLIITDNGSSAWDGQGGGLDQKERDKSWVKAKQAMRRWSNHLLYSGAHQIVCLRAQDKTKVLDGGKTYIDLGPGPIIEKNWYFSISLAFMVEGEIDNRPATHLARPQKWPKAMNGLFGGWEPQLLTPEIGRKIRDWNNTGKKETPFDKVRKRSMLAASDGMDAYQKFFGEMPPKVQKALEDTGVHASNLAMATRVDAELSQDDEPSGDVV
jgi:hypothetical protein